MKVTIPVKEFNKAFAAANSVVQSKPTLPVLSYLKLDVGPSGATLTGSDMGMAIVAAVATSGDQGTVLLPASLLKELLPTLAGVDVTFDITGETIKISSGKMKGKITTVAAAQFPKLEEQPASVAQFELAAFQKALGRVSFAVPTKEGRFAVPVVLIEANGERVRTVATDGGRIAVADFSAKTPALKLMVSSSALPILKDLAGEVLTFSESESSYFFRSETVLFTVRKSPAVFPDYTRATQVAGFKTTAVIEAAGLALSISRVAPFTNKEKNHNYFSFANGEVEVSTGVAGSEDSVFGEGSDSLSVTLTGVDNKTKLNPTFVTDFLSRSDKNVTVELIDSRKLVKFSNGADYSYFVMPVMEAAAAAPAPAPAKETASA